MNTTILTATLALALAPAAAASTPAPEDGQQVVVVAESTSNVVMDGVSGSAKRILTPHEGDLFTLVSDQPVDGSYMRYFEVKLDDGTSGFIPMSTVVTVPQITLDDLTSECVIVAPSVDGSWLGNLASGSNTAYLYPTSAATKVGQPDTGTVLDCAEEEVLGAAGITGEASFTPVAVNGSLAYVRSEYVAPHVDLSTVPLVGTAVAAEDTPVFEFPSATDRDKPIAGIPAGTEVSVGTPQRGFTPVEFDGQRGYAPTSVLNGIETWQSKSKDKLSEWWGKSKEVASDAKDKVVEKYDETTDKIKEKTSENDSGGGFFASVRDTPAMVLSLVLAFATLGLAWMRRLSVIPLPRIARRAMNAAAVVPLVVLANIAPIGTYAWLLWVVLGVTAAVAVGVMSGFRPDFKRAPETMRERKSQIIAGSAAVGGALVGAITTGFVGWLAPLAAGVVALAATLGYLLSAPAERAVEAPETEVVPVRPASPAAVAPTPETTTQPVVDEEGAVR